MADFYNGRGSAYAYNGQYDRAIADYDEAIRINPNSTDVYLNRGNAYDYNGQYDRAIADYDESIRINTNDAFAFYKRGIVKQKKGDTVGGDADIALAKKLDPKVGQLQ